MRKLLAACLLLIVLSRQRILPAIRWNLDSIQVAQALSSDPGYQFGSTVSCPCPNLRLPNTSWSSSLRAPLPDPAADGAYQPAALWRRTGIHHFIDGDCQLAMHSFERAWQEQADELNGVWLSEMCLRTGEFTQAISIFRAFHQSQRLVQLAGRLMYAGDTEGGLQAYRFAVDSEPENCAWPAAYGRALYFGAHDFTASQQQLQEALRLTPDYPTAFFYLAEICTYERRFDEARSWCNKLGAISTRNSYSSLLCLAKVARVEGNLEESQSLLSAAVGMSPDSAEAVFELALVHLQLGQFEQAQDAFERALVLSPRSPYYWYVLGEAFVRMHKYDRALDAFQTALSIEPDYAAAKNQIQTLLEYK